MSQPIAFPNKPLVEAFFEARWETSVLRAPDLPTGIPMIQIRHPVADSGYIKHQASFISQIQKRYPAVMQLTPQAIPHEAQYRFCSRDGEDIWPVIQFGPGLMTYNDTHRYSYHGNFRRNAIEAFNILNETAEAVEGYRIVSLRLHYIDAIILEKDDPASIPDFIKKMMNIELGIPAQVFSDLPIIAGAKQFIWSSVYETSSPAGLLQLLFNEGVQQDATALIWQTIFTTRGDQHSDRSVIGFENWLDSAHDKIILPLFLKLTTGELQRRFNETRG